MVKMILMALVVFFGGCAGNGELTGPSGSAGQTKISFEGGVVKITNAWLDGKLYDLVSQDGQVESIDDSNFSRAVLMGGPNWRKLGTTDYAGGANVSFSGGKKGFRVQAYFQDPNKPGESGQYWLDLGKAACVKDCRIVLNEDHTNHVILLE